jgi:hypothetical protein
VFPVRYALNFCIIFRRNSVFKRVRIALTSLQNVDGSNSLQRIKLCLAEAVLYSNTVQISPPPRQATCII